MSIEKGVAASPASDSIGVSRSVETTKGALWGSGETSIDSIAGPGDDESGGGVIVHSISYFEQLFSLCMTDGRLPRPLNVPNKFDENKDRRGVGSWGLCASECLKIRNG